MVKISRKQSSGLKQVLFFLDLRNIRRNTLDKDMTRSTDSEGTVETIVTMSPSDTPLLSDPTCKSAMKCEFSNDFVPFCRQKCNHGQHPTSAGVGSAAIPRPQSVSRAQPDGSGASSSAAAERHKAQGPGACHYGRLGQRVARTPLSRLAATDSKHCHQTGHAHSISAKCCLWQWRRCGERFSQAAQHA